MPLEQLHIVKKIKFLVASNLISKKQIVDKVKNDANEHRLINQREESNDEARIDHAVKELQIENEISEISNSPIFTALVISILINIILFILFILVFLV